jgi:hypothetical protein
MENRNIYKMDDFLIISSYVMIVPLLVLAWPWLKTVTTHESLSIFIMVAPAFLGPRLTAIILYGCGAVSAQIIGRIIRFKEKQSLEILDTLQFYKKTTIPQLSSQLGMAESKISALVKKMSRISSLGIQFDGENVSIGQKTESSATDKYSSYNTPESAEHKQTIVDSTVEKEFEGFDQGFKEALKNAATNENMTDEQKKEELKKVAQTFMGGKQQSGGTGKKFNVVLFIILFITPLWPIALIYAISFAVKQHKAALTDKDNTGSTT